LLHYLEEQGPLVSTEKRQGRRYRRLNRITAGRKSLLVAKRKVRELFGELFESKTDKKSERTKAPCAEEADEILTEAIKSTRPSYRPHQ